jgi:hypothetical protein
MIIGIRGSMEEYPIATWHGTIIAAPIIIIVARFPMESITAPISQVEHIEISIMSPVSLAASWFVILNCSTKKSVEKAVKGKMAE